MIYSLYFQFQSNITTGLVFRSVSIYLDVAWMASHSWEYISHSSDMDTELDTKAILTILPDKLKRIGELLVNRERLNTADKCYLSRQRAKLLQDYNYHVGDTEAERIRRLLEQGLSRCKIAKALGRSHTTISKYLKKMALA